MNDYSISNTHHHRQFECDTPSEWEGTLKKSNNEVTELRKGEEGANSNNLSSRSIDKDKDYKTEKALMSLEIVFENLVKNVELVKVLLSQLCDLVSLEAPAYPRTELRRLKPPNLKNVNGENCDTSRIHHPREDEGGENIEEERTLNDNKVLDSEKEEVANSDHFCRRSTDKKYEIEKKLVSFKIVLKNLVRNIELARARHTQICELVNLRTPAMGLASKLKGKEPPYLEEINDCSISNIHNLRRDEYDAVEWEGTLNESNNEISELGRDEEGPSSDNLNCRSIDKDKNYEIEKNLMSLHIVLENLMKNVDLVKVRLSQLCDLANIEMPKNGENCEDECGEPIEKERPLNERDNKPLDLGKEEEGAISNYLKRRSIDKDYEIEKKLVSFKIVLKNLVTNVELAKARHLQICELVNLRTPVMGSTNILRGLEPPQFEEINDIHDLHRDECEALTENCFASKTHHLRKDEYSEPIEEEGTLNESDNKVFELEK